MQSATALKCVSRRLSSSTVSWSYGTSVRRARAARVSPALPRSGHSACLKHLLAACILGSICSTPTALAELDLDKSDLKAAASKDWKKNWAVPEGFSISIDTEGYHYPTAIAFVPNPGDEPKDPLYFVTELRGKVKVVTNDRTIYTFAEGFLQTEFYDEPPSRAAEFGLGGICLEPAHGYVFITFAYQDDHKILRNNIIRFKTRPGTFSLAPESQVFFTDVFAPYESGPSHQIGGCAVDHEMLYVGVGDGFKSPLNSQQLDSMQGKIIRMALDGKPVPTNPFYEDSDIQEARNYVWAYGLRNPFGLAVATGHVIVAENGLQVDRFVEVQAGKNYLWDGTDQSLATNAAYILLDSLGPVQMGYYPATASFFPEGYADQFYVAMSADDSIRRLRFGLEDGRLLSMPELFVKNKGDPRYNAGLALGPDGLYFAPLLPIREGKGAAVIKVKYEPERAHAITLAQLENPAALARKGRDLMREKGCFGCHRVTDVFEQGGAKGPVLDQGPGPMLARIQKRISTNEYLDSLKALDARDEAPFNRYVKARKEVAQARGIERARIWMKYRIMEPRFDSLYSTMPNLGVTEAEAEAITRFLLPEKGVRQWIKEARSSPLYKDVIYAFNAGVFVGLPLWAWLSWLRRLLSRRRSR